MVAAAVVEIVRLNIVDSNGLQNDNPSTDGSPTVPMSVWWQVRACSESVAWSLLFGGCQMTVLHFILCGGVGGWGARRAGCHPVEPARPHPPSLPPLRACPVPSLPALPAGAPVRVGGCLGGVCDDWLSGALLFPGKQMRRDEAASWSLHAKWLDRPAAHPAKLSTLPDHTFYRPPTPCALPARPFNLWQLPLGVTWQLVLWPLCRRSLAALGSAIT